MPSRGSDKCRLCSKLSLEQALQKHGPEGTGCWEGEPCHKRRTYYKNRERYNRSRRIKYNVDKEEATQLNGIPIREQREKVRSEKKRPGVTYNLSARLPAISLPDSSLTWQPHC